MSSGAVAERYAQAIFELGREQNELGPLREQLQNFARVVAESEPLEDALTNPLVPAANRAALIQSIAQKLGMSSLGARTLLVVARRGRIGHLSAIVECFSDMVDNSEGVIRASVVTATEMPESYYSSLTDSLQQATSKRVILQHSVDPDLIGGAVAQVGDSVLDVSVRGRLEQFELHVLSALKAGIA